MAETTRRFIETIFTGKDAGLGSLLTQTASGGAEVAKGLMEANSQLIGFLSTAKTAAIGVVVGGTLTTMASKIMDVGQAAEKAQISLGGILSGQGIAKDYNDGLLMAQATLAKIEKDAAALPGEAQEFQEAFQTAASAIGTSGMELEAFVDMSNKMVAAGKIFGQDAAQSGRDIALLIEGRAGMDVGLFTKLAPYMGYMASDAEKFNKLAPEKRMEKLISVVGDGVNNQGKLGDMIAEYGNTWEAISSTITGSMKMLYRVGTAPLFEKGKENATIIMNWLGEHEALLKVMAGGVGEYASNMLTPAAAAGLAGGILGKVAFGFGPVGFILSSFAAKSALGGKSIEQLGNMALAAADKVGPLVERFVEFGAVVVDELTPAMDALFMAVGDAALDAISAFVNVLIENKDGIVSGIKGLASVITWFVDKFGYLVGVANYVAGGAKDAGDTSPGNFQEKAAAIQMLEGQKGNTGWAMPAYSMIAQGSYSDEELAPFIARIRENKTAKENTEAAAKAYDEILAYVSESQQYMASSGLWGKDELGMDASAHIAMMARADADAHAGEGDTQLDENEYMAAYYAQLFATTLEEALDKQHENPLLYTDAFIAHLMEKQMGAAGPTAQKVPKKPSVNQDFRHSRFDIKQQFPNSMDPDRVAVAFRRDIEGVGVRKLQSGITGAMMGI